MHLLSSLFLRKGCASISSALGLTMKDTVRRSFLFRHPGVVLTVPFLGVYSQCLRDKILELWGPLLRLGEWLRMTSSCCKIAK